MDQRRGVFSSFLPLDEAEFSRVHWLVCLLVDRLSNTLDASDRSILFVEVTAALKWTKQGMFDASLHPTGNRGELFKHRASSTFISIPDSRGAEGPFL